MRESSSFTCFVKDEEGTVFLGKAFGSEFLSPLLSSGKEFPAHGFVVSCYGIPLAGKTLFLKSATEEFKEAKRKLFAWDRFKPEHAKINGFDFHYADFGAFTNPLEREPDYLGRPRKEWLWTTCGYPLVCSSKKPAFYLFEHPPLPHLLFSQGIVVILGHPLESFYTNIYVKAYERAMEEILTGRKTRNEIMLNGFEGVRELSAKLLRAKIYDPVYIETGDERYIGFILTSRYSGHSDLFLNFRKKAAEAKLICG